MQQAEFNHTDERDRLNREAQRIENEEKNKLELLKIYGATGEVADVIKNGGNLNSALLAGKSSNYIYEPTLQNETEHE